MIGLEILLTIIAGLIGGSFFNVLIVRLPRHESIIRPGSHCPVCNKPIAPHHNIPLVSWLVLRGRCARCGHPISVQYPLIEAASAGIVMVLWFWYVRPHVVAYGPGWRLLPVAVQAVSLWVFLPLAVIDGRHGVLPDSFTLSGLLLALGVSFFPYGTAPLDALIGAVTGGGILFVIGYGTEKFIVKRPAIGGGDIKFMAWAGALWGWQSTFMSIFFGSVLGLVLAGIGYALSGAYTMKREIPFGPFLVVGVWISAFFGEELLAWYFGLWGMSG